MNIIQDKNWVITTKKGKGKLPLFHGNVERVIPIYDNTAPPRPAHEYWPPPTKPQEK